MSTSTIPAVFDEIRADLAAKDALARVLVCSGPPPMPPPLENLVFWGARSIEDELSMGGNRLEAYVITGTIWIVKPGSTETVTKAARDRAFDIFAVVESYIEDDITLDGNVIDAEMSGLEFDQFTADQGMGAEIEFTISVQAQKAP